MVANMDSRSPTTNGSANKPYSDRGYTMEEAAIVDKAKGTHKETTQSAARAAKTAEQTREIAANTLDALHQQGQKLEVVERDLYEIDADVVEAKGILKYMRRCCLFFLCSCCCECDPNAQRDETRKARVKQRQNARKEEKEMYEMAKKTRQEDAGAGRSSNRADKPMSEEQARSELLSSTQRLRANIDPEKHHIGDQLAEDDRLEVRRQTNEQDKHLDVISDALSDLQRIGEAMGSEVKYQDAIIERNQEHVSVADSQLRNLSNQAVKDHRLNYKRR
ncbi:hypothetical protein WJX77_007037 [Trebouxia sp. C0004]